MAPTNPRRRGARDPDDPDDAEPAPVRDPGPTFLVIGLRLVSAIALIVALVVGQWASSLTTVPDPAKGPVAIRVVYGLTEATAALSDGGRLTAIDTQAFSSERFADDAASAAGTSKTIGMGIIAAMLAAILLAAASLGHSGAMPRLKRCAGFAWIAAAVALLLGLLFMTSGLAGDARSAIAALLKSTGGPPTPTSGLVIPATLATQTSGGFSYYVTLLALIFLSMAWARSAVEGVDEKRRQRMRRGSRRR